MATTTIGDLARDMMLRRQNTQLRQTMTRVTEELASGRASDTTSHLGARFSHLAQVEHDLSLVDSYRGVVAEAGIATATMQQALGQVRDQTASLVSTAAVTTTAGSSIDLDVLAAEARGALDSIISGLNTNVAGRHLFSGVDVTSPPLASADTLITDLSSALGGLVTVSDILTAADAYFDTSGGSFETIIYTGATDDLAAFHLGAGESVELGLRADDPGLRDVLKNVALTALLETGELAIGLTSRKALLEQLRDGLFSSQGQITSIRADLGFAENRIEQASTRIETERSALEMARNTLLSIDPFDAATELEAAQIQLETLYTITARTSRLSLVNFLS